ncbi:hypothetical protein [Mesorhizobium amorphae]|uniref:hypothetical protein n=1 Tax=Mesorhizobium amorphae TaxID=71433 RepID=UPI0011823194|nr:hypothetical protein [Mesorhizobium amorphae]
MARNVSAFKEVWKHARAELDAIIDAREVLQAQTQGLYDAALAKIDEVEALVGRQIVSWCDGCDQPVFRGARKHAGSDGYRCTPGVNRCRDYSRSTLQAAE